MVRFCGWLHVGRCRCGATVGWVLRVVVVVPTRGPLRLVTYRRRRRSAMVHWVLQVVVVVLRLAGCGNRRHGAAVGTCGRFRDDATVGWVYRPTIRPSDHPTVLVST